ncbi:MAG: hypothetical protein J6X84_04850 [Treponema sp.]|nr:hypothetical protein [Treponema sp.]
MKNKLFAILTVALAFLMFGCASTSANDNKVSSYAIMEMGEFKLNELENMTDDQLVLLFMYEPITELKITSVDGSDYYNDICLKGMPLAKIKELMGADKFAAYFAMCMEVANLQRGKETRLMKFIYQNDDYIILNMADMSIADMNTTVAHSEDEIVDVQILIPVQFELSK